MTEFNIGERATLKVWGRPLCIATVTKIGPNGLVWITDDQGRSASFNSDGTSGLHCDQADTHIEHTGRADGTNCL